MTPHPKKPFRNLLWMGVVSLLILFALAPVDQFVAKAAWHFRWQWGADFFNMNLYEHGVFGLADIVVTLGVGTIFTYLFSFTRWGTRLIPYRRGTGFVLNTGFTMAVSIVHSMKWVTSRTRPHDWFPYNLEAYSHWFEFGSYPLQVGFNRGAFPGGHVATMSVLLAFFYLMPDRARFKNGRWVYAGVIVIVSLLMGWYRMMSVTHWLTDNIASLLLSIMVVYGLYHFLHFPNDTVRKTHPWTNSVDERRPGWELMFMVSTLAYLFALASIMIGLRIAFLSGDLWQGLGIFALGNVLSLLFFDVIYRILFRRSWFKGLFKNKTANE